LDRLPLALLDRIRNERANGRTWDEIERDSPQWKEWDQATPEALAAFPGRRLPHSNVQRWHDLRVEQVQRERDGQTVAAQALAERLASRGIANLGAAVQNALGESVFRLALEGADEQRLRDELCRLAQVIAGVERGEIARQRLALDRQKLQLAGQQADVARLLAMNDMSDFALNRFFNGLEISPWFKEYIEAQADLVVEHMPYCPIDDDEPEPDDDDEPDEDDQPDDDEDDEDGEFEPDDDEDDLDDDELEPDDDPEAGDNPSAPASSPLSEEGTPESGPPGLEDEGSGSAPPAAPPGGIDPVARADEDEKLTPERQKLTALPQLPNYPITQLPNYGSPASSRLRQDGDPGEPGVPTKPGSGLVGWEPDSDLVEPERDSDSLGLEASGAPPTKLQDPPPSPAFSRLREEGMPESGLPGLEDEGSGSAPPAASPVGIDPVARADEDEKLTPERQKPPALLQLPDYPITQLPNYGSPAFPRLREGGMPESGLLEGEGSGSAPPAASPGDKIPPSPAGIDPLATAGGFPSSANSQSSIANCGFHLTAES
jgi:hypothetical protein